MPSLVNLTKNPDAAYDVYIGRPSEFGNPFVIGVDGNRKEVLENYGIYARARIIFDRKFRDDVLALKGKILGCHCAPAPCHGNILIGLIEEIENGSL